MEANHRRKRRLVFLVFLFCGGNFVVRAGGGSNVKHRRCYGDVFGSKEAMVTLLKSTCQPCSPPKKILFGKGLNQEGKQRPDVAFMLSPWDPVFGTTVDMIHPMLSLSAMILRRGLTVSLFYLEDSSCNPSRRDFSRKVLSSMPCDLKLASNQSLSIHSELVHGLNVCENQPVDNLPDIEIYRVLDRVPPMMETINRAYQGVQQLPRLLVVDSRNVAGILWAESKGIPTIIVADPEQLDLVLEKQPTWEGFLDAMARRLQSLDWGWRMMKMNWMRKSLGLTPYTLPSDHLERALTVLLHPPISPYLRYTLPYHTHAVRPIVSECVVCDPSYTSSNNVTVMVTPLDVDKMQLRAVIRGIGMAKSTLKFQSELVCDGDYESTSRRKEADDCRLYRFFSNLEAVLLVRKNHTQYLPELLPPFVKVETGNPVDCLARHPFTFAFVSHCGPSSYVASSLGIALLCLPKQGLDYFRVPIDARLIGGFHDPKAHEIAAALFGVLVDGRARKNHTISTLPSAADIIITMSSALRNASLKDVSFLLKKGPRKPARGKSQFEWVLRGLLGVVYLFLGIAVCYSQAFLESVKLPSQIPAWKRRFRYFSRFSQEIDPLLIRFQQWMANPDAFHNKFLSDILDSDPLQEENETKRDAETKRDGSSHNPNPTATRRRKAVKKR